MAFERHDKKDLIPKLQKEPFWQKHLKDDCENGEVFFAIRNDRLDFYHNGGRLFSYTDKGFTTHVKYAAVIVPTEDKNYLTEEELRERKLISEFASNLKRIKKNCALYSDNEAKGVSKIYQRHSYLFSEAIVILDIEVAFESNKDRIDILLFDTKSTTLRFVEAKHFSNPEIWSKGRPKVVDQIERYQKRLRTEEQNILGEYTAYVHSLNSLFGITLPKPKTVDDKVSLLIFGFDGDQKKGRLSDLVLQNKHYKGLQVYPKGNVRGKDGISLEELWNTRC